MFPRLEDAVLAMLHTSMKAKLDKLTIAKHPLKSFITTYCTCALNLKIKLVTFLQHWHLFLNDQKISNKISHRMFLVRSSYKPLFVQFNISVWNEAKQKIVWPQYLSIRKADLFLIGIDILPDSNVPLSRTEHT